MNPHLQKTNGPTNDFGEVLVLPSNQVQRVKVLAQALSLDLAWLFSTETTSVQWDLNVLMGLIEDHVSNTKSGHG